MYLCQASLGFTTLIHACQRKECLRNFFDLRTIQLLAKLALDYVTRCAITSHAAVMPMTTLRKFRLAMLLLVLGCAVGCDQSSKHIARKELSRLGAVALPGGFGELWLAENPGVFLSLGVSLPQSLRLAVFTVGVGAGLVVLFAYLVGAATQSWLSFVGFALILAGGVSNLIDRITRQGLVTDFIVIHVGPLHTGIFNLADITIMIGMATLICAFANRRHAVAASGQDPQNAS
jgi:signal peptidase II